MTGMVLAISPIMTNTTIRETDAALLAACREAAKPTAQTGWKHPHNVTIDVRLPDDTVGTALAWQIMAAAPCNGQEVLVRQGGRLELWFPSQLRLA